MTTAQLRALLADWDRLREAVNDSELLGRLPQLADVVMALPDPLRAFQARWVFGNCTEEVLHTMKELHPEIVSFTVRRQGYRYSKTQCCKLARLDYDGQLKQNNSNT